MVEDGSCERFSGRRTRSVGPSEGGRHRSGIEGSKRVLTSIGTGLFVEWRREYSCGASTWWSGEGRLVESGCGKVNLVDERSF